MKRRGFFKALAGAISATLVPLDSSASKLVDPLESKFLLVPFKGKKVLDAGYFYAPYQTVYRTPVVMDFDTFNPRRGIMTRYSKNHLEEGEKHYETVKIIDM